MNNYPTEFHRSFEGAKLSFLVEWKTGKIFEMGETFHGSFVNLQALRCQFDSRQRKNKALSFNFIFSSSSCWISTTFQLETICQMLTSFFVWRTAPKNPRRGNFFGRMLWTGKRWSIPGWWLVSMISVLCPLKLWPGIQNTWHGQCPSIHQTTHLLFCFFLVYL